MVQSYPVKGLNKKKIECLPLSPLTLQNLKDLKCQKLCRRLEKEDDVRKIC